ncbi:endo-beta-N-acetylglucosaminidase [Streptomyces gobiensis]|uniref:endo-beta-N-acetylglucosaminidase n=1 Tax=Streptomyces gobiensis TaxID=2875706 RepID=UPI001E53A423|nr:endo-beta-N-acetylglucosaminidase [Streptomyces gobiensis]UGY93985.1 endo-beta-N-acetylglucosaminidase [Streptomyces gobiensis]
MTRPPGDSPRPSRRTVLLGAAATAALPWLAHPARAAAHADTVPDPNPAPAHPGSLQPYASYWFPESFPEGREPDPGAVWASLKEWTPEGDPDLPFNVSTVPLADRFTPQPANPAARDGQARISALAAFAPTAQNPSQGGPNADYYALTHWAYLDELVFWGGSAGEGIILAPGAPVVDAAHRAGVPVLGNVFLPPTAYGGDLKWTRELVQRDTDGRFPLAAKLIQVARVYGFDGWFLNGETGGGDAGLGADFADFVRALRAGAPELRITWYDAFTIDGQVAWQGALNDKNAPFFEHSDSLFIDFRWRAGRDRLPSSAAYARAMGRDPYELWAGLDVEANGWRTKVDWDAFVPEGRDQVVSYGLYRPDWTLHSLPGDTTTRTPAQFHARDNQFWTGEHQNPADPSGPGDWRPAARHIADRSTVTALPFATTFNTGHGTAWYEDGERTGDSEWNQLSLQDPLPARRWVVHGTGPRPSVGFDFAAAWHGGSSVLLTAEPDFSGTLELFHTRLPLSRETVVELVHRAEPDSAPVRAELAIATAEPRTPGGRPDFCYVPAATVRGGAGWTTTTVRIGRLPGAAVRVLGVRLTGRNGRNGGALRWRLGALAVRDGAPEPPKPPSRVRITDSRAAGGGEAELRIQWEPAPGPVHHYELHQRRPDGSRAFLGGTSGSAYYIPALRRSNGEPRTRVEVRAVTGIPAVSSSPGVPVDHQW